MNTGKLLMATGMLGGALVAGWLAPGELRAQEPSTNKGATGGQNSGPATTGVSSTVPGAVTQPAPGQLSTSPASLMRPVFISGSVMIDDGSPVPPSVSIQRVCNGTPRAVAYTDGKGQFSFQWGQTDNVMADASEAGFGGRSVAGATELSGSRGSGGMSGGMTPRSTLGCDLRASLVGYRSDTIDLFNRSSLDSANVGVIVLHHVAGVAGTSVSASALLAPKDARKAYDRGLQSLLKNKPEDAAKDFEKAVAAWPKYADAWVCLGKIRRQQNKTEPARAALLKAISADPKLVPPYLELGFMSAQASNWDEAEQYLGSAVRLDPVDYPVAWYTIAVADYNLKKYDAAEGNVRHAVKLDPRHGNPREQYLLGLILEEKEDFAAAEEELSSYVKYAPSAADVPQVQAKIRQIEKMLGEAKQAAK